MGTKTDKSCQVHSLPWHGGPRPTNSEKMEGPSQTPGPKTLGGWQRKETERREKGETEEDRQRGSQRKYLGATESEKGLKIPGRDRTHLFAHSFIIHSFYIY